MNEIVKIHNDLTNEKLSKLSAKGLDLFIAICYKLKDKGTNKIVIPFSELRSLASYKTKNSNAEIEKDLNDIIDTMFFVLHMKQGNKTKHTVLFESFETDTDNKTIEIEVKSEYAYIFTDIASNFTLFELKEFVNLSSKYSKKLYKLLKQFRSTGLYVSSKEQIYIDLGVPEKYTNANFNTRALNVSLNECSKCFKNLNCEPLKSGRGGAVHGYKFTFEPERPEKEPKKKGKPKSNKFNDFDNKQNYNFDDLERKLLSN